MSNLIVIAFDDEHRADEVLNTLNRMQREHLVDLEDAAVVIRNEKGKVKIKQTQDLVGAGMAGGGLWGMLIGLMFLNPLCGILIGAATGGLMGALRDVGINDDFIKELGNTIKPGTSAIFVLIRKSTLDRVLDELKQFGGKVLHTSLSKTDESELREALEGAAESK